FYRGSESMSFFCAGSAAQPLLAVISSERILRANPGASGRRGREFTPPSRRAPAAVTAGPGSHMAWWPAPGVSEADPRVPDRPTGTDSPCFRGNVAHDAGGTAATAGPRHATSGKTCG